MIKVVFYKLVLFKKNWFFIVRYSYIRNLLWFWNFFLSRWSRTHK